VRLQIHYTATDVQQAYALWVTHCQTCRKCLPAEREESSPCRIGRTAWAVYATAYTAAGGVLASSATATPPEGKDDDG